MSGANLKPGFRVSDVRRLIEAVMLTPVAGESGGRKALAWVELYDQPGLAELYVFDGIELTDQSEAPEVFVSENAIGTTFELTPNSQRQAGGYTSIHSMNLALIGLGDYSISPLQEGEELVFHESPAGATHLVIELKSRYDPLLGFRAHLEEEDCLSLVETLEKAMADVVGLDGSINALKLALEGNVDPGPGIVLQTGPVHYGLVKSGAPVDRTVTIDASLVPGHVPPTLVLALLSAKFPGSLAVESALIEQPDGTMTHELCDFFHAHAEHLDDAEIAKTFEEWVEEFGGTASMLRILQSMPAPNGVSAYF